MTFGKNRVQYNDERTWNYFRFKKFDTYYYEGGKALAIYASSFAAREIKRISSFLDYSPESKFRLMIFNDLSDLKETNMGLLTNEEYNIGGTTFIIDNKIFLYFNGYHADFEKQISKGLAQAFVDQIMYGGSVSATVKNSMLLSFPAWFTTGLVSYLAEDWSTDIDNEVRDGFLSGRFERFNRLTDKEQVMAGHSIWKYVEERYGRRALSDLFFMAKINRSIESAFVYVLGVSYEGFMNGWIKWYKDRYIAGNNLGFDQPGAPSIKTSPRKRYYQAKISADGRYLLYCENNIGKVRVRLYDRTRKKTKTLMRYGYKLNEKVDYSYPLVAWSPRGHFLSIIYEKEGKNILKFYDVDEKQWTSRYLMNFDKILSVSFNPKGNMLAMSAVQKGQSDIFLYNIGANNYKRITYDLYDDLNPVFANSGKGLIFASNRPDDTLRFDVETGKNITRDTIRGMKNNDIFYYKLTKKGRLLKRITQTPDANEKMPQYLGYGRFSWLSNQSGIYNRMLGQFDSAIAYIDTAVHYRYLAKGFQTTRYAYNIQEQNMSPLAGFYCEVINQAGHDKIYVHPLPDYEDFSKVEPIYTVYMLSLKYKKEQAERRKKKAASQKTIKAAKSDSTQQTQESTLPNANPKEAKHKKFKVIYIGENNAQKSEVDINRYNSQQQESRRSRMTSEHKTEARQKATEPLFRPLNYETQFSLSQAITQMDFSYINLSYQPYVPAQVPIFNNQGFAAFMKFGVTDLLEDYRITGGIKFSLNFQDNEYLLNFTNLKKRLDRDYTFHRMIQTYYAGDYIIKDYIHEIFLKYSWPFDNVRSLRTTFNLRNDWVVVKSIDRQSMEYPDQRSNRAGFKLEYVYDNSRSAGLNILYGTRYKLFGEYFQPIEDLKSNTFILGFDYRKYIRLVKYFVWANRAAGSTSFGSERLLYYLGGVDNWMMPRFNRNIQVDQGSNYIFQTTATNMRGFDQNIRNGNSFVVINSELRLPVFRVLSAKPLKSNFLNNFMVVGFFDVGTAWTGPNPFSDSNSLFKQTFYQKPITVTVINQNDPIVAGYGFGLRSQIMGYYVRADWAWGIQNGYIQRAKFYLSLSLDF